MLALHLLQSALVHVNTLLVQQILTDPTWADTLTDADRRALSPPVPDTHGPPTADSRWTWTAAWSWA